MGMRFLTRLRLAQFRSHGLAELAFDQRPVVLFGQNGSGKTNLLEAISLLSPGRGLRRAASADMARAQFDTKAWQIDAELRLDGAAHEFELRFHGAQGRAQRIDGKSAPQLRFGEILPMIWLVPAMDRLWTDGAEARRRFLDRMVFSCYPTHARDAAIYEKAMRERNRLLKDRVNDSRWYGALEQQMAEHGANILQNRQKFLVLLNTVQEQEASAFPRAYLSMRDPPIPTTRSELAQAFGDSRARDIEAGRSLIGPHRSDLDAIYRKKDMPAAHCSTGEQKALLISLILANARLLKQQSGAAPLILLDEIAAHLDPKRRAALYDELCAISAQVFMTGTEASLFDALGAEGQYFHVTAEQGTSAISAYAFEGLS